MGATIKDNYVVVYELLDEMLDNGFPLATESNILKELIKPPNMLRTVVNTVTGKTNVSATLPTGQLSNVPWRRSGVKYTNNEAYFDVIEEVDAIIDKSGATVSAEIHGYIDCAVKLTGMPDLSMSFVNPRLFDDVSFHPCVRYKKWESERLLSFVPPDGNFRLMSYHVGSASVVAIPVYLRHSLQWVGGATSCQARLDITVSKQLVWEVGKIDPAKLPNIRGTVNFVTGSNPADTHANVSVHFSISQLAVSGLKVNRLDMYGEKYKPFKGVKYITKAGKFQVRM